MLCRFLLVSLLLAPLAHSLTVGGNSPPLARRHTRAKRDPASFPNPLISARQVKADVLRRAATKTVQPPARGMKRQGGDCPTPQVSGGCCPHGQQLCTQTNPAYCTTFTSPTDCGACGNVCSDTQICSSGNCKDCGYGYIACNGKCLLVDNDSTCGSCTNSCGAGQTCYAKAGGTGLWGFDYSCICNAAGTQNCGGVCVSTSDPNNCGACGATCDITEYCSGGACVSCPYGDIYCGGSCVISDTASNCGACGVPCTGGTTCFALGGGTGPWGFDYSCSCLTGFQECNNECVLLSDPGNCGSCGNACPSGTCCNEQCVYPEFDHGNCGTCGNACTATEICFNGACESCPEGYIYCADVQQCVDASNYETCGSCSNVCPYEQVCLVTPGSGPWGNNYECGCPAGYTLCGTECKYLSEDVDNCGTCGHVCDTGVDCNNGQCCPDSSPTSCNGACTNTLTSTSSCGSCGNTCSASQTCTDGSCVECADICDGVCTDLQTDQFNCGTCGNSCTLQGLCNGGSCSSCPEGEIWCGGSQCDGTEGLNCGTCDFSRCNGGAYHPGQICWLNAGGSGPWGYQYCCGGEFGAETTDCVG